MENSIEGEGDLTAGKMESMIGVVAVNRCNAGEERRGFARFRGCTGFSLVSLLQGCRHAKYRACKGVQLDKHGHERCAWLSMEQPQLAGTEPRTTVWTCSPRPVIYTTRTSTGLHFHYSLDCIISTWSGKVRKWKGQLWEGLSTSSMQVHLCGLS